MKNVDESRNYDFRKRTKAFALEIIRLYSSLPKQNTEVQVCGKQLLRSGTSVAANYREAYRARSTAEFISKPEQCLQAADESQLWLELLKRMQCNEQRHRQNMARMRRTDCHYGFMGKKSPRTRNKCVADPIS